MRIKHQLYGLFTWFHSPIFPSSPSSSAARGLRGDRGHLDGMGDATLHGQLLAPQCADRGPAGESLAWGVGKGVNFRVILQ